MTRSDALVRGLLRLGYAEHKCRSSKYREFRKSSRRYLVGDRGALRVADAGDPITKSVSVSNTTITRVIAALGELGPEGDNMTPKQARAWILERSIGQPWLARRP